MRINDKALAYLAMEPADKEGRLSYKSPGFREVFKERWFKLKGNLLFYFRLNEHGAVYEKEPAGMLLMEQCRVQQEDYAEVSFTFSITFSSDIEKRHYFGCPTQKHLEDWIIVLKEASYEYQHARLKALQAQILKMTGRDPLAALSSKKYDEAIEETDSDVYFTRVHPVSKVVSVSQDLPLY